MSLKKKIKLPHTTSIDHTIQCRYILLFLSSKYSICFPMHYFEPWLGLVSIYRCQWIRTLKASCKGNEDQKLEGQLLTNRRTLLCTMTGTVPTGLHNGWAGEGEKVETGWPPAIHGTANVVATVFIYVLCFCRCSIEQQLLFTAYGICNYIWI